MLQKKSPVQQDLEYGDFGSHCMLKEAFINSNNGVTICVTV
jgi:hypothetical protein